jgi:putative MFS transporter
VGFGVGGSTIPFDLLAEFAPSKHRGTFLIYIEYFWTIGSIFVVVFAWFLLTDHGWRALSFTAAIPVCLSLGGAILLLPESPRWLLAKGRVKEAEQVIAEAAILNSTAMSQFSLCPIVDSDCHQEASIRDLLGKEAIKISIPLWIVWFCFGVAYYGLVLLITSVFSTGDSDDDGSESCSFNFGGILQSTCAEIVGVFIAALTIDRWGRIGTQSVFYAIGGVTALMIGIHMPSAGLLVFSFLARLSAMASSCAAWVILLCA